MEVEFKTSEKMVYIWLTKADAENAQLRESLKPFYQKCKSNGVLCAVFISGSENLREGIRDLLIYNKYRLDEIEYRKTHKDARLSDIRLSYNSNDIHKLYDDGSEDEDFE